VVRNVLFSRDILFLLLLQCAIINSTYMVGEKGLDDVPGSFQQKKDLKRIPEFAG
jgi:hypothetical protein